MATRPFADNSATPPAPVADRLLLAEELLDLAERAQSHTRAAGSAIALQRGEKLYIRTSTGVAPEVGTSLPIGEGAIGQCARQGKPCNVSEEDKIDASLRALGVRSLIAVPIHHAGIFYGVLVVVGQAPETFSRMHVAIMMTMGNEVARVIKRMEPVAMEIAPGAPLRAVTAPAPIPDDNVVTIALTPTAQQNIVETLKTAEQKPVAAPMKLMIDQPLTPKPAAEPKISAPAITPAAITSPTVAAPVIIPPAITTPTPAQKVAAVSVIELEAAAQPATKPLPELLCPGDDPRRYGTLKAAKSLEPQPTFVTANTFAQAPKSSSMKTPAIAAAVLVIAVAGFGMWRHGKTPTAAPATVAAAEPAVVAPTPTPVSAPVAEAPKAVAAAPAPITPVAKTEEKKPAEAKLVETKLDEQKPAVVKEAALHIAAPVKHTEVAAAEAPNLTFAGTTSMPVLPDTKAPAASLLVRRTTATPPALVRSVAPVYPDMARRAGTFGDVRLQVTVSPEGKVANIHVTDGAAILRQAATNAVSQWQYRPATLDGRAVESTVEVVVKFAQR